MATNPEARSANKQPDVSLSPFTRLAGPLALTAGALFTITQLVTFATLDPSNLQVSAAEPVYLANGIVYFVAFCLLLLALIATYGWEAHKAGTFGIIGFSAAVVGTFALGANVGWFEVFVTPWLVNVAPEVLNAPKVGSLPIGGLSSYLLFVCGWVLFGIASLRARVFPLAISLAIIVSALVAFPSAIPPYGAPFGLTIAGLGVWMLRTRKTAGVNVEPATITP
jgi:hypothetical protein